MQLKFPEINDEIYCPAGGTLIIKFHFGIRCDIAGEVFGKSNANDIKIFAVTIVL